MTQAWSDARFFRLIAVSNIQRAFLAHHALYRKTVVIPNFLDLEAWESVLTDREPERKVVYVGALKPTKGFNHLANVWRAIRERHPDWTLSVCGSPGLYGRSAAMGPEGIAEADFERTILAPLGGSRRSAEALGVHFVGSLTKQDLAAEIRASAAVVVNPNTSQNGSIETFCVSAAEAMALGVPVIGGAAGGLLEVVAHGEGGLLAGDEAELQKALLALIENPARARELGLGGQERVRRHFTKARAIERWRDLLSGRPIAADTLPAFKYGIWGYYLRVVCGWVLPLRVVQMVRDGRRNILTGFRS
jgi:glycosyltransferase involved in cell wall biosynthesis